MKALAITALIVVLGIRAAEATTYKVCSSLDCYNDLQSAVDAALRSNTGGNATIEVGSGTWLGATISGPTPGASGPVGQGYLVIKGQGGDGPTKTTIKGSNPPGQCGTIIATNNASVMIQDLNLETSETLCQSSLFVQNNAVLQIWSGVSFGLAISQHMHAESGGVIEVGKGYTVSAGAYSHWAVGTNGIIEIDPTPGLVITFSKGVNFIYPGGCVKDCKDGYFAWAQSGGVIFFGGGPDGATFFGLENVTAAYKYLVISNGVIDMNESTQELPGTSTLPPSSGGQYVDQPAGRGSGRRGRPR